MRLDNFVPESLNHQNMNCVEEKFLDTHIDHIILKWCGSGKLRKEARRKEFRRKEEQKFTLHTVDPESLNHQKTNCVEEDEFLDTHIDHTILKGCGKLQKEARRKEFRRKEEELRLDTLVPETSTHLHHHIKK